MIVSLTPEGTTVAADCDHLSVHVQEELARLFPAEQMKDGYAFLRRIDQRLAELEGRNLYAFRD